MMTCIAFLQPSQSQTRFLLVFLFHAQQLRLQSWCCTLSVLSHVVPVHGACDRVSSCAIIFVDMSARATLSALATTKTSCIYMHKSYSKSYSTNCVSLRSISTCSTSQPSRERWNRSSTVIRKPTTASNSSSCEEKMTYQIPDTAAFSTSAGCRDFLVCVLATPAQTFVRAQHYPH